MKTKLILSVKDMENEEKWLELRKSGIGGSDASSIVDLNPWKSQFQLWLEKTGQVEAEDLSNKEVVYWGKVLEQAVADRFSDLTGKKLRKSGLLQDNEVPYFLASPDRMIIGENAGLECKTTGAYSIKEWEGDNVPTNYYIQCQWYMMVTGCETWYIACLIGGNKFVWKPIARNEEDINSLIKAGLEFWNKVQNNIMPAVDGSEDCSNALFTKYNTSNGLEIELPSETSEKIEELLKTKELIKDLTATKKKYENELKLILGENEVGRVGEHKISWKVQKGRDGYDTKKLVAEQPEIAKKYFKQGKETRVFRVK